MEKPFTVVFQVRDKEAFSEMSDKIFKLMQSYHDADAPYTVSAASHYDEMGRLDAVVKAVAECDDKYELQEEVKRIMEHA